MTFRARMAACGIFFQHEVFDALPAHLQDFLIRTSSLGVLTPRICGYVLDNNDAGNMLAELLIRNTFVLALDGKREQLLLHPLFKDWMSEKSACLAPVETRLINARAEHWCIRHGIVIPAAKHQILASEREDIFDLVLAAFPHFSTHDLLRTVASQGYSDNEELAPSFLLMAAWAYAYSADVENMRIWSKMLRSSGDHTLSEEVQLSLDVLDVKGLCLECEFERGVELAASIDTRLHGQSLLPLRVMLANCRAEAFDQQGMIAKGMEMHLVFSSLTGSGTFSFLSAINQYEIAYSLFRQGQLGKALQACRALRTSTPHDHPVLGAVIALEVMIAGMRGQTEDAQEQLDGARKLVSKQRNADMYLDWCIAQAWLYATQGRTEKADEVLLDAMNVVKLSLHAIPRGTSVLPFQCRALLRLTSGSAKEAPDAYADFDRIGVRGTDFSTLLRQYVELLSEEGQDLEPGIEHLRDLAQERGYGMLVLNFSLDLAIAVHEKGQRTKAARMVHDALELAAKEGIVSPFCIRGSRVRPVLVTYVTTIKADYPRRSFVQKLLRQPEIAASQGENSITGAAIGLTAREMEILHLASRGMTRSEIAQELCLGESTVKSHLSHMYAKFGVNRFEEMLSVAGELGM